MTSTDGSRGAAPAFKWLWAGFVLFLSVFPYVWNFWSTPPGSRYLWIIPPYPEDSYAYAAWARQAYLGRILFSLKYTALPHPPFLFQPFFLVCGRLARAGGLEIGVVFLLVKSLGVILFFLAFFRLIEFLGLNRLQSAIASIFAGVSSGFGALQLWIFGNRSASEWTPTDLKVVDANTFWSLLWNPLYPYALALMLSAVYLTEKGLSERDGASLRLAGLALGLLALIHPYELAVLYPLLVLMCLSRPRDEAAAALGRVLAPSLPFAAYAAGVSFFHPLLRMHRWAGAMESPPLWDALLGFGVPGLLASIGLAAFWEEIAGKYRQSLHWICLALVLSVCPFWFQRKLIFGAHIPVCVLGAVALDLLFSKVRGLRRRRAAMAAAGLILAPLLLGTPIRLLKDGIETVRQNARDRYRVGNGLMEGLKYLRERADQDDIVYASIETSEKIAAYSGNTVLWGHWAQSVDYEDRLAWSRAVLDPDSREDPRRRSREFWGAGIKYLFLDGGEKTLLDARPMRWLSAQVVKVFENGSVRIYRRKEPAP